jgi:hypothetical protein
MVRLSRRTNFPASAGNNILRISDKYLSRAKVRDIRPQTKTEETASLVSPRGVELNLDKKGVIDVIFAVFDLGFDHGFNPHLGGKKGTSKGLLLRNVCLISLRRRLYSG